ncbi:ArnT family glycosyltransferase [Lentzea kentuckyensis]|uniref:ArnT family glycosyltransferase n=1 Tax=Lentzea kentuckyensis TaxID=360086 RepID=UPI001FE573A7|nr:glycosyltransferase family 39 protein [Lentzea kentuckyensis]
MTAPVLVRTPLARRPLAVLGGAVFLLFLVTSAGFGYTDDELYFLSAGRHLDWGYADQPPLVPLLAHLADSIAPHSLIVLRLPSTIAVTAGVLVTALIARELGGGTRAQLVAAACYAISPLIVADGHHLDTTSLDWALWTVALWLLVRWNRTRDDRLLLAIGVVTAVALQAKFLIVFLWLAVLIGVLISGPRELVRRPMLWAGAGIALLSVLPGLWWQAHHGWPQLEMGAVLAEEAGGRGGRVGFLAFVVVYAGLVGGILFVLGVIRLFQGPHRYLGWTAVVLITGLLALGQQPYYVAGIFPVCWAAAAVSPRWRWTTTAPAFAVSALLIIRGLLPFPPTGPAPDTYVMNNVSDDFPAVVPAVTDAYARLSPSEKDDLVLMAGSSGYAGALEQFGQNLPPVYCYFRGSWYFGAPPEGTRRVLYVGEVPDFLSAEFRQVRQVGVYTDPLGLIKHPKHATQPLSLLSDPVRPWSQLWPRLRHLEQIGF